MKTITWLRQYRFATLASSLICILVRDPILL